MKRALATTSATLTLTGCPVDLPVDISPEAPPPPKAVTMTADEATASLTDLPESPPEPMQGYSRDEFPHWLSASNNGWEHTPDAFDCDVRDATLWRDGENVQVDPDTCSSESGTWTDPYTGETLHDSADVDIDHVVSLASAWRSGANGWSEERRTEFANDPLVVVASASSVNKSKGDKAPDVWKPDNRGAWCPYAIQWVEIKSTYSLHLTSAAERTELEMMLNTCP